MWNVFTPGRLAFGGASALAVGAVLWLLPGTPVRPLPAFADVERAMQKIETATWTESTYYAGGEMARKKGYTAAFYTMRRQPEPIIVRRVGRSGAHSREFVQVTNRWGTFTPPDSRDISQEFLVWARGNRVERQIDEALFFPVSVQAQGQWEAGREYATDWGWKWKRGAWKRDVIRDGSRSLLRFAARDEWWRDGTTWAPRPGHSFIDKNVWVDPRTFRVVRSESRQSGNGPGYTVVRNNFRYNVAVRDDADSFIPAPGKRALVMDVSLARPSAPSVPAADIASVKTLLERTGSRWQTKTVGLSGDIDGRVYGDSYRFLQEANGERRLHALTSANRRGTLRTFRIARLTEVRYNGKFRYTRRSARAPFPPTPDSASLSVIATVNGTTVRGKSVSCPALFEFTRAAGRLQLQAYSFFPDRPGADAEAWTQAAAWKRAKARANKAERTRPAHSK